MYVSFNPIEALKDGMVNLQETYTKPTRCGSPRCTNKAARSICVRQRYFSLLETRTAKLDHAAWFKIGLPAPGPAYDAILRGKVVFELDGDGVLGYYGTATYPISDSARSSKLLGSMNRKSRKKCSTSPTRTQRAFLSPAPLHKKPQVPQRLKYSRGHPPVAPVS